VRCECPSSIVVFHVRYFKTSAARIFCFPSGEEVVTVNTPPFSESITEGDVRWEKAVGDSVKEDEVVCEIETDKTSLQVPSPAAGVITELLVPDGGRVEAGNPLFKLKKGGTLSSPPSFSLIKWPLISSLYVGSSRSVLVMAV
uniref:Lipoyl-binding domain-containing protein n=1 Tax=Hucho hucho TaxID=62062 RepID=A0A4W5KSN3_9TELE